MVEIDGSEIFRKSITDSFLSLVDNAVRAGCAEQDVALLLMELAEAHLMTVGAGIIVDGALNAQSAHDGLKN